MKDPLEIIDIMADSHGNNDILLNAILSLKSLGAKKLIHLGDMCDSLRPELMDGTVKILSEQGIQGLKGNNECDILLDIQSLRKGNASPDTTLAS